MNSIQIKQYDKTTQYSNTLFATITAYLDLIVFRSEMYAYFLIVCPYLSLLLLLFLFIPETLQ